MAYAAVISLKHTIERLKNPINPQITKSVYEELKSLGLMLKRLDESSKSIVRSGINALDAKIREVVWKLEDVVDAYQLSQGVDEKGVEQEMDSFFKAVKKLRREYYRELQNPSPGEEGDVVVSQMRDDLGGVGNKSTTIGLSDLSEQIRTELLHGSSELETVSLFGMAGIGKTHLASQIYHHPLILQHFEFRAWVTVGPKDQIKNKFVDFVAHIDCKPKDMRCRRYLLVLDDIWSTRVLYCITPLLPNYGNGSRILLTTRLQEVARYWTRDIHQIPFLNKEESWNLLCQNVFVDESTFPSHELEKAGRKIAEKCEGLPLLILTVANILRGLDKNEEYWNKVAEQKTSTFTDAYDQIYEVLVSSYEYLPQHLKPCFLYMGVFPQGSEIPSSKLVNLWIVEDFLESSRVHQKVVEFAMKYMEDLVSNSVSIVCKQSFERFRRIKSSKLHCTYWHVCVKEARKNKFFHVLNKLRDVSIESQRRLSVQNNMLFGLKEVSVSMAADKSSITRSLLFTGTDHQYPVRTCFNTMLLMRVLDALAIRFYEFPTEVLKLLQLRYLTLTHNGELSCFISKLQQLQCLILRRHHNIKLLQDDSGCLPKEIWEMQELRHVRFMGSNLPDPSKNSQLPNLLTLYVNAHSFTEDVFKSIPNLQKLGIILDLQPDAAETLRFLEHIGLLYRLESLKCVVVNPFKLVIAPPDDLSNLPGSLKKLSLNGLGYSWKYMSVIGSLPNLKVLKLRLSAFQGPVWEAQAGQFKCLEFLLLEDLDLQHWRAKDCKINRTTPKGDSKRICKCLPSLRHLIIRHCFKLNKIPWQIGDNSYLERLEVDDCSPTAVASAYQMKEKRKSSLKLEINSSWKL